MSRGKFRDQSQVSSVDMNRVMPVFSRGVLQNPPTPSPDRVKIQNHEDLKHNKNLFDMLQKSYSYFVRGMADGVETHDSIGQHELPLMVSTQNEDFEACNTYCVGE